MNLLDNMIARAKANQQRVVLPEGSEERTLRATDRLVADGVGDIILLGDPAEIKSEIDRLKLTNAGRAKVIDPKAHDKKEAYTQLLYELRKKRGMTPEEAAKLVENPLYLACLMIKSGDADGEVAGAQTRRETCCGRPCKLSGPPGSKSRFGSLYHAYPNAAIRGGRYHPFADCAVMPTPLPRSWPQSPSPPPGR